MWVGRMCLGKEVLRVFGYDEAGLGAMVDTKHQDRRCNLVVRARGRFLGGGRGRFQGSMWRGGTQGRGCVEGAAGSKGGP